MTNDSFMKMKWQIEWMRRSVQRKRWLLATALCPLWHVLFLEEFVYQDQSVRIQFYYTINPTRRFSIPPWTKHYLLTEIFNPKKIIYSILTICLRILKRVLEYPAIYLWNELENCCGVLLENSVEEQYIFHVSSNGHNFWHGSLISN